MSFAASSRRESANFIRSSLEGVIMVLPVRCFQVFDGSIGYCTSIMAGIEYRLEPACLSTASVKES